MEIAKQNIFREQKLRAENSEVRGEPLNIGDIVRYKLDDTEKSKYGGKKIAPRNSARYQVVKNIGTWTYRIRPIDGSGQEKVRHFNELIPMKSHREEPPPGITPRNAATAENPDIEQQQAPLQQGHDQRQTASLNPANTSEVHSRPRRKRTPPERLILDPGEKSYKSERGGVYFDDVFEEEG